MKILSNRKDKISLKASNYVYHQGSLALKPTFTNLIHLFSTKRDFYTYIRKQFYYSYIRRELSKYIQHGSTSIMRHTRRVAYFSYTFAKMLEKRFNITFDYESLIIGAYLHDLFMYDWHEKNAGHRLHGFSHPKVASRNAQDLCQISKKEQSIIESHMWPLTITKVPKCREAFIVCLFDKYAAILETFNLFKFWV